jgi:hypothetical protein
MQIENPITYEVTLRSVGLRVRVNESHDNIFVVSKISDTSEHGNVGIYCIYHTSGWYGYNRQYDVPLGSCVDVVHATTPLFVHAWSVFSSMRGIKIHARNRTRTKYNPKKAHINDFLNFLKEKYD